MSELAVLSCLIAEDNEANRLTLEHYVALTDTLVLAASLPDGASALNYLQTQPTPDVLLLDIELPHLTGLDLVRALLPPLPAVVLVTSHEEFAIEAFGLSVADYLVKPVEYPRFLQAMRRVRARLPAAPLAGPGADPSPHLFVKTNGRLQRVNFDEVLFVEALATYSVLVTPTHKHIVYATLKSLEARLPFAHFMRIHRSYIVNMQRIETVEDHLLRVGAYEVPLGQTYREAFLRRLRSL